MRKNCSFLNACVHCCSYMATASVTATGYVLALATLGGAHRNLRYIECSLGVGSHFSC
jgi:hypothetical protein